MVLFCLMHAEMEAMRLRWFVLIVFLHLHLVSKAQFNMAADAISREQPLSGNQTVISDGGNFELGFFTPGQSRNYYIGIWYKKLSVPTVVWVANRETPLPDTSSQLKISEDGNLILVNHSKMFTWSSNSTSAASIGTVAILLDNGNLVLRDKSNSSLVIWQSFDHPTDTWLPEQKFGVNKVTGRRPRLISWRNSEDPAPGAYSLQIEADGTSQYFMLWNNSYRYWRSGVWDGQWFSLVARAPQERPGNTLTEVMYITTEKENYLYYPVNDRFIGRQVMGASGQLHAWRWDNEAKNWYVVVSYPADNCDVLAICGAFGVCDSGTSTLCECLPGFQPRSQKNWEMGDWTEGCAREEDVICPENNITNGKKIMFHSIPNMKLPLNPRSLVAEEVKKCEATCLDDCYCSAYSYNSSGCFIWKGDLLNLWRLHDDDINGGDLHVRILVDTKHAKRGVLALVIVSSNIGLLASLVIISLLIWRCQRRLQLRLSNFPCANSLILFRYRDLRGATKDFAERLGGGSFGSVFKGILPDSSVVAVKKLEGLRQGEKQFRSEVSTIGKIQHVNLVRLRGFCSEGNKRLLVYDLMPNGSLASHLFGDEQSCNVLSWKVRYQIALGIAKGLAYLHEECRECILHCDIKPENILLDEAFCPKVADFGMAKLLGREFSRVLTTMRGTIGYLAPEWILGMAVTTKTDVYSYGLMVLEIISGSRNSRRAKTSGVGYFPLLVASKIREDGDVLCLSDPKLGGNIDTAELNRLCRVACWCIQENEGSRPSMAQIVLILEEALEMNVPPIPRFLQTLFPVGDTIISSYVEK